MDDLHPIEYYQGLRQWSVDEVMKDFDVLENYERLAEAVTSARSLNFLIDFDDDNAWCGFDLDSDAFTALLKHQRPQTLNTRWINIWLPHDQKDTLEALAKNYDFTPRLLGFMQSQPLKEARSLRSPSKTSFASSFRRKISPASTASDEKPLDRGSPQDSVLDPELNSKELIGMVASSTFSSQSELANSLNPYFLANEIWHYSSVDWGRRYVALGYNTIHNVPRDSRTAPSDEDLVHEDRPYGKRVWSWLILCEDRTVITVHEDPYPTSGGLLSITEKKALSIIRRNLINTFRQLSKARDSSNDPAQIRLPLRTRLGDTEEETVHRSTDVPGLLFYYLYDDWLNTYSLIARREHRYAAQLDRLRIDMLEKAELSHVDRLHHIGRQLGVLKRIYQSYELIIDRVLEKQEPTLASLKNSKVMSGMHSMEASVSALDAAQHLSGSQIMGVSISSAARVRFERLKQRIRLYALNEVLDCIDQKDSLVMMNFNLIAIKESFSVERLTRVTLLLAKVTMLFMPVSLMSAYFGCQFVDASFTVKSYWYWFAGIMVASVVGLVTFSLASGTTEGNLVYKPIGKRVMEFGVGRWNRTKKKVVDEAEMEEKMF